MEKFEMRCQRIFVLVLVLVGIPVILMLLMFAFLIGFIHDLPDWAVVSIIAVTMSLIFFIVYKAVKALSNIDCEVYLSAEKIIIKLKKPSFIFGRTEYESTWNLLQGVSSNYAPQQQQRFYKISFMYPPITISLDSLQKVGPSEETEFGTLLMNYVNNFNAVSEPSYKPKIDTANFYEGNGPKFFTAVIWILLIVFTIAAIAMPEKFGFWRIIQFAAFASVWFSAYYINRRKKKK